LRFFDFMKTSRHIIWPAILAVAGLFCWLAIPQPQDLHSTSSYDYYYIPQNRTPEVSVSLRVEARDLSLPLNSAWGRKYE
jgi:hypothetical protein